MSHEPRLITQFPHCDQRVLHKPGECEYCDRRPEWQELREAWGTNFTGQHEEGKQTCPAEAARPLETINQWGGNVPAREAVRTGIVPPIVLVQRMIRELDQLATDAAVKAREGPRGSNAERQSMSLRSALAALREYLGIEGETATP